MAGSSFRGNVRHEQQRDEDAPQQTVAARTPLEARQEAEIETVYRTAPIGLALFDPVDFRYLRLNDRQAEFFGLPPEHLLGKTVTEMAPIPGVQELFEQVAAGKPVINYPLEGELVGRPGEYRYWTVNYFPVYDANGRVQAISAASLEITHQRRAELALIQNERVATLGRLASSISHEINNPLEAVTNLLYLIATDPDLGEESKGYLATAQSELSRVSQIVTQSLRFQRHSAQRAQVRVSALIDSVLKLYQHKMHQAGVAAKTECRSERQVFALENEIRQVLSNVVENALDAMPRGGTLRIRVNETSEDRTRPAGVRITIADTGEGMSASTMTRIFEPFFTTKAMDGNGLGLWISSDIIKRHGGSIRLRSSLQPARRGTVISIYLPGE